MRIAEAVLALGLGNRVNLVRCWHEPLVDASHPPSTIHVGVLLNPQSAGSLVERGPTPSDAAAVASWKRLWGEKSETRRFKDGAIVHSVVWHAAPEARHGVVAQAAAWLLARHLDVPAGGARCSIGGLDAALIAPGCGLSSTSAPRIAAAFEKLCSAIRSLRGLPLAILAIQPVSSKSPRSCRDHAPSPGDSLAICPRRWGRSSPTAKSSPRRRRTSSLPPGRPRAS